MLGLTFSLLKVVFPLQSHISAPFIEKNSHHLPSALLDLEQISAPIMEDSVCCTRESCELLCWARHCLSQADCRWQTEAILGRQVAADLSGYGSILEPHGVVNDLLVQPSQFKVGETETQRFKVTKPLLIEIK